MTSTTSLNDTQAVRRLVWETLKRPATATVSDTTDQEDLFRVNTHLVLIQEGKQFAVYWAPALTAVVVRVLPQRGESTVSLAPAIKTCALTLKDMGAKSVIIDLTEVPTMVQEIGGPPWSQLMALTEQRMLIAPEGEAAGWKRVDSFRRASVLLRVQGLTSDETDETYALLKAHESVLIAGSYSGCVYWLPKSRTVAFIWGGHDADQNGCRLLYAAATAHTQYLRVQNVIADVSNRISLDSKGRQRLQTFIEAAVFRGATRCAIVGDMQLLPRGQESMEDYLDTLAAITRVDFVSSLSEAFELTTLLNSTCALDS